MKTGEVHMQALFERLPQPEAGRDAFWHICWLVLLVSFLDLIVLLQATLSERKERKYNSRHIVESLHSVLGPWITELRRGMLQTQPLMRLLNREMDCFGRPDRKVLGPTEIRLLTWR